MASLIPGAAAVANLLDLGRVALEKVAPADPEERRRWLTGKQIGQLAGLVAYLDVRIPDLERLPGMKKRAAKLRGVRARAAAQLREARSLVLELGTWETIATRYRTTIDELRGEGAELVWPDGRRQPIVQAFRSTLAEHELRRLDAADDEKAGSVAAGGADE